MEPGTVLGHEFVGEVVAVGSGARGSASGTGPRLRLHRLRRLLVVPAG